MLENVDKVIDTLIDLFAYTMLNEKQREVNVVF